MKADDVPEHSRRCVLAPAPNLQLQLDKWTLVWVVVLLLALLLGTRTLLGAPGIATRSKDATVTGLLSEPSQGRLLRGCGYCPPLCFRWCLPKRLKRRPKPSRNAASAGVHGSSSRTSQVHRLCQPDALGAAGAAAHETHRGAGESGGEWNGGCNREMMGDARVRR